MTRSTSFLLLVSVAGCASATSGLPQVHAAAIQDSIRTTLDAFRRHSTNRQWDSLAAMYAPDSSFRWIENGEVRYRSAGEIRTAFARLSSTMRIETTYRDTEIMPLAAGIASVLSRFETRFMDSTTSFSFGGAISMVLMHRANGWKIVSGHSSAPIPRSR